MEDLEILPESKDMTIFTLGDLYYVIEGPYNTDIRQAESVEEWGDAMSDVHSRTVGRSQFQRGFGREVIISTVFTGIDYGYGLDDLGKLFFESLVLSNIPEIDKLQLRYERIESALSGHNELSLQMFEKIIRGGHGPITGTKLTYPMFDSWVGSKKVRAVKHNCDGTEDDHVVEVREQMKKLPFDDIRKMI